MAGGPRLALGTFWEPSRNLLGLWLVDPASRYTSGSYLQLTSSLARQLSPTKAELLLPALRDEAHALGDMGRYGEIWGDR